MDYKKFKDEAVGGLSQSRFLVASESDYHPERCLIVQGCLLER
jgi:hypothetical protein